jgi:SAM-dependent methyltransferase
MTRRPATARGSSIRGEYVALGVERYYREKGRDYRNPHEQRLGRALRAVLAPLQLSLSTRVLDLACGSGEVTLVLGELGFSDVEGADPHTAAAYLARTGKVAQSLSFEDIEADALLSQQYGLIVCSFALHLVAAARLPRVVYQLSRSTPLLLLLSPHKRPQLKPAWGFALESELLVERVRARLYRRVFPGSS